MAKVVAAHGVGQQLRGRETLAAIWLPSMRDGLAMAGYSGAADIDLTMAFYGDLFRRPSNLLDSNKNSREKSTGPSVIRQDVPRRGQYPRRYAKEQTSNLERDLLYAWYQHSEELDPGRRKSAASEQLPRQRLSTIILARVFRSRSFAAIGGQSIFGDARQLSMYMQNVDLRMAARERFAGAISSDTRVAIGHSLGAVVAYETLCLYPESPVTTFVTLGCPLGIRNLIFDRLEPRPQNEVGKWPDGIRFWHNIVDPNDIVALGRPLRPLFGPGVNDHFVDNGNAPHSLERYLSSSETGQSIASGLRE